jgi:hypothetical protein
MEAYYRGGRIRFTEQETDQKDRSATSACCLPRCGEESQVRPSLVARLSKHEATGSAPGSRGAARWNVYFRFALTYKASPLIPTTTSTKEIFLTSLDA